MTQPQSTLVVERQQKHGIESLGMRCDEREIPEFWMVRRADSYWIAPESHYRSNPYPQDPRDGHQGQQLDMKGTVGLAVLGDRVAAILSPNDFNIAALWFTFDRTQDVVAVAHGSVGALRKRPKDVELIFESAQVLISDVAKLLRSSGSFKSGQAAAFQQLFPRRST